MVSTGQKREFLHTGVNSPHFDGILTEITKKKYQTGPKGQYKTDPEGQYNRTELARRASITGPNWNPNSKSKLEIETRIRNLKSKLEFETRIRNPKSKPENTSLDFEFRISGFGLRF